MTTGVILGSAYDRAELGGVALREERVSTRLGEVVLHREPASGGVVLFRHAVPHRYLPHQIPYRAHALALEAAGVRALLVTSSVGLLDPDLPLHRPLLVCDLLMPENRLPDGSACSIHEEPSAGQGHLVLEGGLLSEPLSEQVAALAEAAGAPVAGRVVFAYAMGPRSKTAAENRFWRQLGAQVNSMTLGPEVVLANELEIPTAALVVGHKHSVAGLRQPLDHDHIAATLELGRRAFDRLALRFLERAEAVPFGNRIYRY